MTLFLRSDGGNDWVDLNSSLTLSDDMTLTIRFKNGNDDAFSDSINRVFGINNGNRTNYGKVTATTNRFRIRTTNTNVDFDWDDITHSFADDHTYSWDEDGADTIFSVDGNPEVTLIGSTPQIRLSRLQGNIGALFTVIDLQHVTIDDRTTSTNSRVLDSDLSLGTGSVLPDGSANNVDGDLTDFPGDDSQWITVSSGTTAEITETGPSFTESINTTLTAAIHAAIT